jgi:hypothetical protein
MHQMLQSVVPLIKDIFRCVLVKNDDHLVKLTAIVQRYISTKQTISGADGLLSDEEKMQHLLRVAEQTLSAELTDELGCYLHMTYNLIC